MKRNCLDPEWDEHFRVAVCHKCWRLEVVVKDREHVGGQTVGWCEVSVEDLLGGREVRLHSKLQVTAQQGV